MNKALIASELDVVKQEVMQKEQEDAACRTYSQAEAEAAFQAAHQLAQRAQLAEERQELEASERMADLRNSVAYQRRDALIEQQQRSHQEHLARLEASAQRRAAVCAGSEAEKEAEELALGQGVEEVKASLHTTWLDKAWIAAQASLQQGELRRRLASVESEYSERLGCVDQQRAQQIALHEVTMRRQTV